MSHGAFLMTTTGRGNICIRISRRRELWHGATKLHRQWKTHTHTGIICKFRPNFGMKALRNSTHFCGGTFLARSNPIPRRARPIIGEATRIYRIDPGIQSAADESGVGANRVAFHGGDGSFASQSTRILYRSGWWFIPTGWWNRNIHSRSRISIEKSEW